MDARTYQELAARTASEGNEMIHSCMGIAGESGEIVDYVKKGVFYGRNVDPMKLMEELGDLAWYMNLMMNHLGYSWGMLFDMNIKKLSTRYPDLKFDADRAINRDDDAEQAAILG